MCRVILNIKLKKLVSPHIFVWTASDLESLRDGKKVKVKAVCGYYSTAALRHIVLLPE